LTDLIQRSVALHAEQRIEEALETITAAARTNPDNAQAAFGHAQLSFEAWRPAADLFAHARTLAPGNPDLIRNHALALAAEGQEQSAQELLETTLVANPAWLDGHRTLASLCITAGDANELDQSYNTALSREPQNAGLWLGWFQQHATLKQWSEARRILIEAQKTLGVNRRLVMAELFLDCEAGNARDITDRFTPFADLGDPGLDICHVRHLLRSCEPARAEAIAARHIGRPSARMFWPYLSLCWRLLNDSRADWLDGDPLYTASLDLDFNADELAKLAVALRDLHRLKAPYPEQSVRGGTQTERQLFFHPDPAIQAARVKIAAAVGFYLASLPDRDETHPLLASRRDAPILFEGSWSVRLSGAGFHSSHTHPLGWLSSAFYVSLPDIDALGPKPSGWLSLGTPPSELNLELAPCQQIEPRPGRLALFPSTMWHSTTPFSHGERLTMAFDVQLPTGQDI
jgi:Tfp pilus assembly protein PilF